MESIQPTCNYAGWFFIGIEKTLKSIQGRCEVELLR